MLRYRVSWLKNAMYDSEYFDDWIGARDFARSMLSFADAGTVTIVRIQTVAITGWEYEDTESEE